MEIKKTNSNTKIDEKLFKNEIGDSKNSIKLQYFSISNFINNYEDSGNLRLEKIICKFFKIIYPIKFIMKETFVLFQLNLFSLMKKKKKKFFLKLIFSGLRRLVKIKNFQIKILENKKNDRILDEIILQLNKEENIYCIKGFFQKEKIEKFMVITSHGKFSEFGEDMKKFNFQWDYHHNQKTFDGFIVGWDESHINYLANIYVNNLLKLNEN